MSRRPKRVYIESEGRFWSFTPEEWMEVADEAAATGAFQLPEENLLRNRPRNLRPYWNGRRKAYSGTHEHSVHWVDDWSADDIAYHARVFRSLYYHTP